MIWDIIYVISSGKRKKNLEAKKIPIEKFDTIPPKLLAIIIAAWHEENVLAPLIANLIASTHYPASMYHIFLGIYPNDANTIVIANSIEKKYENVHVVMNKVPGPTSKAQNLNNIISYIRQFQMDNDCCFRAVIVHDSEDVVHPYELKAANFLLEKYNLLQFPVFPLQKKPTLKNYFSELTAGTYADEFAENHFRVMKMRNLLSGIVPSAGTGFVISKEILQRYKNEPLFPENSLTEDYNLSVKLAKDGYHMYYVLEKVKRLLDNEKLKWDYIAIRSMFPRTFRTAVRQKTRWVYGITMQSLNISDIFGSGGKNLNLSEKYTLYRDFKSKYENLLILPGYIVFIYFIVSLFTTVPIMYPLNTLSGWLCVFLTFMMLYRQIMRAVAIKNIYGFKSMIISCFTPPIMPFRFIWGNIINFAATVRAWEKLLLGGEGTKKQPKIHWSKTDHEFLEKYVLYRYYRNIGDVLLEKQYIELHTLKDALKESRKKKMRLGDILLERNAITEEHLMIAVAASQHKLFVKNISYFVSGTADEFDKQLLTDLLIYPLFKVNNGYVMALTNFTPPEAFNELVNKGCCIYPVYTTKENILQAINTISKENTNSIYNHINNMLMQNKITWEQAILAIDNQDFAQDIIEYMGICTYTKAG